MKRSETDVEPYWPTLGATGSITQLSDRPVRRKAKLPFGSQPPRPRAKKANRR